jgi:hypothetical protein
MSDEELRQLIQSNARAVQSMLDTMAQERLERDEKNRRLDEAIIRLTDINEGVVRLLSSLDEDRPTILRKLTTIENKTDRILNKLEGEPS